MYSALQLLADGVVRLYQYEYQVGAGSTLLQDRLGVGLGEVSRSTPTMNINIILILSVILWVLAAESKKYH